MKYEKRNRPAFTERRALQRKMSQGKGSETRTVGRPRKMVDVLDVPELTEGEKIELERLVAASPLAVDAAKRGLALDFVRAGRLLDQIVARAKAGTSLLDDPKHWNAAVSNRRRLLQALQVVDPKPKEDPFDLTKYSNPPEPKPQPPKATSPDLVDKLLQE